ncbi:hypothetical protein C8Q78DRAFT_1063083 [Trametes maxima]|nr:hypothetical protein C8Q78DRAFT_1063083 [Trametes maxima]
MHRRVLHQYLSRVDTHGTRVQKVMWLLVKSGMMYCILWVHILFSLETYMRCPIPRLTDICFLSSLACRQP